MNPTETLLDGNPEKNLSIVTPLSHEGKLHVSAAPHPFKLERVDFYFEPGKSLLEILCAVQPIDFYRSGARVFIGDWEITPKNWHRVYPKDGHLIQIRMALHGGGGGGKSPLRTVLQIAVIAASAWASGAFATNLALGIFGGGVATASQVAFSSLLIKGAIGIAGHLLINAIAPAPTPKLGTQNYNGGNPKVSQHYFIDSASNRIPKFQKIPRVLGTHRMFADQAALSYTEISGDDQYLRILLCWGYGPLNITDLKIGETSIDNFEDVEVEHRYGFDDDAPLTLYTDDIFEDAFAIELTQAAGWQTRTTQADVDEISVDVALPRGLVLYDDRGNRQNRTLNIEVQYAPTGTENWVNAGQISVTANRPSEIRRSLRWTVESGQYDVRLKRTSGDTNSDKILDDSYWIRLRSITTDDPIQFSKPVAKTAIRIKASGQLNGNIEDLNALVSSILPIYNGSNWNKEAQTNNPAALVKEVLQGNANARPVPDSEVNLTALQAFYDDCVTNGYTYNSIIDYSASVGEILHEVASAGRASVGRPDGLWTVIMDRERTTPVQHFTPRNSWGFQSEIIYPDLPHAFRVRFPNADKDYRQDERIVYDDGYNAGNATLFEELQLPGITDSDLAWKHGRFHIAQARLRRERYTFWTDIENFVCTRGDLILLTHDVPRFGLASGRIKSVTDNGTHATKITIDEEIDMEAMKTYVVRVRLDDGTSLYEAVNTVVETGQTELTFSTPVLLANAPVAGDLFMFGETDAESLEAVVTQIESGGDQTARIHCVPHASDVYDADTGTIPAFTSNLSANVALSTPTVQDVQSGGDVLFRDPDGSLRSRILITVRKPSALQTDIVTLQVRYRPSGNDGPWTYVSVPAVAGELSLENVDTGTEYEYQLRWILKSGKEGSWSTLATHTVVGKDGLPGRVTALSAQQNGETVTIRFNLPPDLDLDASEIRFIRAS